VNKNIFLIHYIW